MLLSKTISCKNNIKYLILASITSVKEENQNLRDQQTCKICLKEPVSILFLPCGHLVSCVNCAPMFRRCPICRKFINGTVKTFLS